MAKQLKVRTTLSSSSAISSDALASDLSNTVVIDNPISQASELTLAHTPAAAQDILAASKAMSTYVYIKNLDSVNYVSVRTKSASLEFIRLKPGEHAYFPVAPAIGCEVINKSTATTSSKVIYGTFDAFVA